MPDFAHHGENLRVRDRVHPNFREFARIFRIFADFARSETRLCWKPLGDLNLGCAHHSGVRFRACGERGVAGLRGERDRCAVRACTFAETGVRPNLREEGG